MLHSPRQRSHRRLTALCFVAASLVGVAAQAPAQDSLSQASIEAQQTQAALQRRIDSADDATREALERLRRATRQADRLESYNAELAPVVADQARRIESQQQALAQISTTREALPGEMREMVEQLRGMIEADMPFLRQERLARVDTLEQMLASDETSQADKLQKIFSVWRTELDYGRQMDQWSGPLTGERAPGAQAGSDYARQVDYLRVGRTGFYYVTPDGQVGGVWKVASQRWEPLDRGQIDEVRRGIRIARDQAAPALLALPASISVVPGQSPQAAGDEAGPGDAQTPSAPQETAQESAS
ncbi:DUF3450 domain-containing protein [Salinicola sp. DM10]|uniref:DUF3450 domain-containing protein n=1 Tax=Salinicola sp. DM10 TaxID=2815721 RepID=UPI001E2D7F3F|nr:DUF3450 domain-containing protein [Salinicola sp. DM10]